LILSEEVYKFLLFETYQAAIFLSSFAGTYYTFLLLFEVMESVIGVPPPLSDRYLLFLSATIGFLKIVT
jgi:hypothetical protein